MSSSLIWDVTRARGQVGHKPKPAGPHARTAEQSQRRRMAASWCGCNCQRPPASRSSAAGSDGRWVPAVGSRLGRTFFHASSKVLTLRLAMATVRTVLLRAAGRAADGLCCGSCAPPSTRLCCMTVLPAIIAATMCFQPRRAAAACLLQRRSDLHLQGEMHACDMHNLQLAGNEASKHTSRSCVMLPP